MRIRQLILFSASALQPLSMLFIIFLVVTFFFWTAASNGPFPRTASNFYYPNLGRSFIDGRVSLEITPAPELLALSNPYDASLNKKWRLHDAALFHGKYYIYYGATPAVILFAPYSLFTSEDFPQKIAVAAFCSLGFVFGACLFWSIVDRYFSTVPFWLRLLCLLSLGLGGTCPVLIRRPDVYETAISCAYFFLQAGFFCFYQALHYRRRQWIWLLLVGLCLGAAAGSRASYVLGALMLVCLLGWIIWQKRKLAEPKPWLPFLSLIPLGLCALLIAEYNYARFNNPFEFGQGYTLTGYKLPLPPSYNLANIPVSTWFYFLSPPQFISSFPFIHAVPLKWFALHHTASVEDVSGLFIISPISLLALTLPWALQAFEKTLKLSLVFIAGSTLGCMLIPFCYFVVTMRFLVDFAPGFVFLGCIMACHWYQVASNKQWQQFIGRFLAVILLWSCWTGVMLSFTGYYDFLRRGSPEAYAILARAFHPLEIIAHILGSLF